jgi:hypothetical protein
MNERIKQLAQQANITIVPEPFDDASRTWNENMKKFAEAIVRECINKIETHQIPVGNSAAGEMACEWTYDALKQVRDEIKEHFGVEE